MPAAANRSRPGTSTPSAARIVRLLPGPSQRVLPEQAVGPDDPVARHDERHGVVTKRGPDRPDGLRSADLCRDPAVRADLAARDLEGLGPDVALERGPASQVEVDPNVPIAIQPALDRRRESSRKGVRAEDPAPSRRHVGGFELGVVLDVDGLDRGDADPVPHHGQRPDRRIHPGVAVGEPDLDEDVTRQIRRCARQEPGHRGLGLSLSVSVIGDHAVISWRSSPSAASNAVRNRASPRWTCALTVPSGRSSAAATSG